MIEAVRQVFHPAKYLFMQHICRYLDGYSVRLMFNCLLESSDFELERESIKSDLRLMFKKHTCFVKDTILDNLPKLLRVCWGSEGFVMRTEIMEYRRIMKIVDQITKVMTRHGELKILHSQHTKEPEPREWGICEDPRLESLMLMCDRQDKKRFQEWGYIEIK